MYGVDILDYIVELKFLYRKNRTTKDMYNKGKHKSCVTKWLVEMQDVNGINKYNDIFQYVDCKQFDANLILVKYISYHALYPKVLEGKLKNVDALWSHRQGLYRECRGLVINIQTNEIVLRPFPKFFNLNELDETQEDKIRNKIANSQVFEIADKLDGSIISGRYIKDYKKVVLASSGVVSDVKKSDQLKSAYEMLDANIETMLKDNSDYTFMFEHIDLSSKHVVIYTSKDFGLHLIGMRHIVSGRILSYQEIAEVAKKYNVNYVESKSNGCLDEILAELSEVKGTQKEGYVLNIDGYRLKVKSADYVQLHKAITNLLDGNVANIVLGYIKDEKVDDLVAGLSEDYAVLVYEQVELIYSYLANLKDIIQGYYEQADKGSQKEFAIWVQNNVPKQYVGTVIGYKKALDQDEEYDLLDYFYGKSVVRRDRHINDLKKLVEGVN